MKTIILFFTSLLFSYHLYSQVEIVDTKDITDQNQNGKSYQYLTRARLVPTFHFVATSQGTFSIKPYSSAYQNQPPTLDKNFVRTETMLDKVTDQNLASLLPVDKKSTVYNYVDGLGRPTQDVNIQNSPSMSDVVKRYKYDDFSRQPSDFLPYSIATTNKKGAFRTDAENENNSFFINTPNVKADDEPYTVNTFDDSPLNQVRKASGVGKDWHTLDKSVQSTIITNVDNEVRKWTYNGPNPPSLSTPNPPLLSGFIPANLLAVTQTIDEQGQIRKSYKNYRGQVILDRVGDGSTWLDTYSVYDWEGNIFCVIPPEASYKLTTASNYETASVSTQQTFLTDWCFLYDYDGYQRVRAKKIPGASWIYMVYDKYDRLVMTWDGTISSAKEQWIFTKYDLFNRPIMTGFYNVTNGTTPYVVQSLVDSYYQTNSTNRYETRLNSATGYTLNSTFPAISDDSNLLTVTYYDDYAFTTYTGWDAESNSFTFQAENDLPSSNFVNSGQILGQVTGSKNRLLGDTKWLNSVTYYDNKYRAIQTISENHLSGTDRVSDDLDFTGRKKKTLRTHNASVTWNSATTASQFSALEEYVYDHAGRLTQTWQTLDPGPSASRILISSSAYNEKGELIEKNLHSEDSGSTFLQSLDYRYNIRGSLTSLNNSSLSNDGVLNNDSNDIFGMELLYNNPLTINGNNTTPLYNGNINAIKWKSTNLVDAPKEKAFGFTYDFLNRISTSGYASNNAGNFNGDAGAYNSSYSYDRNGNIQGLTRYGILGGNTQLIDNLSYNYSANKLNYVNDVVSFAQFGSKGQGFTEKTNMQAAEYQYDAAGNAKQDLNRGIDITYNHLNRPTRVDFGANNYILYIYDASGAKISEKVYQNNSVLTERHYVGGIHYENGALAFVKINEGRAIKSNGAWTYEYHLKDHQGNVMAAFGNLKEAYAYKAGMEPNDASSEEANFKNLTNRSGDYNNSKPTVTSPLPVKSIITNGASPGFEMGPGIKLPHSIDPGDHINMSVYARYVTPASNPGADVIAGSLLGLATTALGISTTEPAFSGFSNFYPGSVAGVTTTDGSTPKAYLNYILFNSSFTASQFGFVPVTSTASSGFEKLVMDITVPGGYAGGSIYIFATNESNYTTYFDDFFVLHEKTNKILQVTQLSDYYPFGVAFNVWNKETIKANRYTYQGQESQDDLDYNEYMYKFRMHDPSMGRFLSVDPLSEKYNYNSPYAFSGNRVIDAVELEGKEPGSLPSPGFMATYGSFVDQYSDDNLDRGYLTGAMDMTGSALASSWLTFASGARNLYSHAFWDNDDDYTRSAPQDFRDVNSFINKANDTGQVADGLLGITTQNLTFQSFAAIGAGFATTPRFDPNFTYKGLNTPKLGLGGIDGGGSGAPALTKFYPANNGFIGATERKFLMPGEQITRYGSNSGQFFSPVNTPLPMRALPPSSNTDLFNTYELLKPFEVQSGNIAPAFGQPGMGGQYFAPVSADVLLKHGIIGKK